MHMASVKCQPGFGIADDKDPERVLKQVRDIIGEWQIRRQRLATFSLKVEFPSLKTGFDQLPTLGRHEGVYEGSEKNCPNAHFTNVWGGVVKPTKTYANAAAVIGKGGW